MLTHSDLHYQILVHIIEKGYAPDLASLAELFKVSEKEMELRLNALQEYHGVVLHPHETKIWVIHPFSLAPTNFLVKSTRGEWWGNCAWCSLGVAALLQEDVLIRTSSGAHGEPLEVHIVDGEIQEKDRWVHFPIPMRNAWDNVIYTCSTMLLFQNKEEIDDWCLRHNIEKGDVQPIDKIWQFSKKWYGNHLAPDWIKWTGTEASQIFKEFGLEHPIWQLADTKERF